MGGEVERREFILTSSFQGVRFCDTWLSGLFLYQWILLAFLNQLTLLPLSESAIGALSRTMYMTDISDRIDPFPISQSSLALVPAFRDPHAGRLGLDGTSHEERLQLLHPLHYILSFHFISVAY